MSIVLEQKYSDEFIEVNQEPTRKDLFVRIPIKDEWKQNPAFFKIESQDLMVSDRITPTECKTWVIETTGLPDSILRAARRNPDYEVQLKVQDGAKTRSLATSDGFILGFRGKYMGPTWITHEGNQINQGQANEMIETSPGLRHPPRKFNKWGFFLDYLILTDGPARRERLLESAEQQRAASEQRMADSFTKMFSTMTRKLGITGEENVNELPQSPEDLKSAIQEAIKSGAIAPEQVMEYADEADPLNRKKGK